MARITREGWLLEGLEIIAGQGFGRLTLTTLRDRLQVTHGSFYHHFRNRDDYIEQLLERWRQTMTLDIIDATESIDDFDTRIQHLVARGREHGRQATLERALRAQAQEDPLVRHYVESVDRLRIEHCERLALLATGDRRRAPTLARLIHAMFVGMQQVMPLYDDDQVQAIYAELIRLVPGPRPEPAARKRGTATGDAT